MSRRPFLFEDPEKYSQVCEAEYKAGKQSSLMRLVVHCAIDKRPIPEWAAKVLEGAWGYAVWDAIGSWDEVFGKPNGKPCPFKPGRKTTLQRKIRNWQLRDDVLWKVVDASENGRPIDNTLFSEIGRELGIGGKTEVKRLYAVAHKAFPIQIPRKAPKRRK
jgi:hypothetical protein